MAWGKPVLVASFPEGRDLAEVKLPAAASARYLKLMLLNAHNEENWAAIAEFSVYAK